MQRGNRQIHYLDMFRFRGHQLHRRSTGSEIDNKSDERDNRMETSRKPSPHVYPSIHGLDRLEEERLASSFNEKQR